MIEHTREKKPCTKCGFERVVKVTRWEDEAPRWKKLCGICDLVSRAESHESAARGFRRRAAEMLAKRGCTL